MANCWLPLEWLKCSTSVFCSGEFVSTVLFLPKINTHKLPLCKYSCQQIVGHLWQSRGNLHSSRSDCKYLKVCWNKLHYLHVLHSYLCYSFLLQKKVISPFWYSCISPKALCFGSQCSKWWLYITSVAIEGSFLCHENISIYITFYKTFLFYWLKYGLF